MIDLSLAKEHLNAWLKADLTVSQGQAYQIGSRQLTRADASIIADRIKYWNKEVMRLSSTKKSRIRVKSIIPRDI